MRVAPRQAGHRRGAPRRPAQAVEPSDVGGRGRSRRRRRHRALGAKSPWYRCRWTGGGGPRRARRSSSSRELRRKRVHPACAGQFVDQAGVGGAQRYPRRRGPKAMQPERSPTSNRAAVINVFRAHHSERSQTFEPFGHPLFDTSRGPPGHGSLMIALRSSRSGTPLTIPFGPTNAGVPRRPSVAAAALSWRTRSAPMPESMHALVRASGSPI